MLGWLKTLPNHSYLKLYAYMRGSRKKLVWEIAPTKSRRRIRQNRNAEGPCWGGVWGWVLPVLQYV